jgi:hypothetical protein
VTHEDWSPGSALPRADELPVAEQGYERAAVQQAFDAFYRHIAQLDSTLRTLDAVDAFQRQAAELRAELRTLRSAGWTLQPWRPGVGREPSVRTGIPPAVPRVLAELVLLIVLAVFVGVGHFAPWVVIVVMAAGALLVTVVEVFASRERLPARAVAVAQERLGAAEAAAAEPEPSRGPEPSRVPEQAAELRPAEPEPEPAYGWSAFGVSTGGAAEPLDAAAAFPPADEPEPGPVGAAAPGTEPAASAPEVVPEEPSSPVADERLSVVEDRAGEEAVLEPAAEPVEEGVTPAVEDAPEADAAAAEWEAMPEPVSAEAAGELDEPTEAPLAPAPEAETEAEVEAAAGAGTPRRWFGRRRQDDVPPPEPVAPAAEALDRPETPPEPLDAAAEDRPEAGELEPAYAEEPVVPAFGTEEEVPVAAEPGPQPAAAPEPAEGEDAFAVEPEPESELTTAEAEPEPTAAEAEPEPTAAEAEPEPTAAEAESEATAPEAEGEHAGAAEPEPDRAGDGWPEPVGWPLPDSAEDGTEAEAAAAPGPEPQPAGGRRRWFGRRRGAPEDEPEPAPLEPPRHVRVLPPSEAGEDPWERGFDDTMEPLGYADPEAADEVSEDTEDDLSPRGLRRRRR